MAVNKTKKPRRKKQVKRPSVEIIALLKQINAKLDGLADLEAIAGFIKRNQ